jgi:hypothetical protein
MLAAVSSHSSRTPADAAGNGTPAIVSVIGVARGRVAVAAVLAALPHPDAIWSTRTANATLRACRARGECGRLLSIAQELGAEDRLCSHAEP